MRTQPGCSPPVDDRCRHGAVLAKVGTVELMTWGPDTVYLEGLDFFTGVVARLQPDDWEHSSPCAGWRAVDVLGHVGTAVEFGTNLLRGRQMEWKPLDPPGAGVEGNPADWWQSRVPDAKEAMVDVDLTKVVESPFGSRTIAEGLSFPAIDLFVHAWDLGAAAGIRITLPDEVVEFGRSMFANMPAEMIRSPRVFAEELETDAAATASDAFLAWTGRDPNWQRPQA